MSDILATQFQKQINLKYMIISELNLEYGRGCWKVPASDGYVFTKKVNFDKIVFQVAKKLSDEEHDYYSALKRLSSSKYDILIDALAIKVLKTHH